MMKQPMMVKYFNRFVQKFVLMAVVILIGALYAVVAQDYFTDLTKNLIKTEVRLEPVSIAPPPKASEAQQCVTVHSSKELRCVFEAQGYDLELGTVKEGVSVPALYVHALPKDFNKYKNFADHKDLFLQAILPHILAENARIKAERETLIALKGIVDTGGRLLVTQEQWIEDLAMKYKFKNFTLVQINELLRHVDEIPVSMALAQSVEETGWGTSYAARIKRATHGVTLTTGVKSYASLAQSVQHYMLLLNSHSAYKKMRQSRAFFRTMGQDLCSIKLMEGLVHYSELGQRYIQKVKHHIRKNDLKRFDDAQLVTS
jgi:Bax protein